MTNNVRIAHLETAREQLDAIINSLAEHDSERAYHLLQTVIVDINQVASSISIEIAGVAPR